MKNNLIKKLKIVVDALKNDTILYVWTEQESCNCGVVAQALLCEDGETIKKLNAQLFDKFNLLNASRPEKDRISPTWKNAIKYFCPITGKSNFEIINKLEELGLSKNDIVHLEFLENPAILSQSGIEKIPIYKTIIKSTKKDTSFLGRLLSKKIIEYGQEKVGEEYPKYFYTKKENLIKYLTAWIKILSNQNELTYSTDNEKLNAELLIAVNEENFEQAAVIRDQLCKI